MLTPAKSRHSLRAAGGAGQGNLLEPVRQAAFKAGD